MLDIEVEQEMEAICPCHLASLSPLRKGHATTGPCLADQQHAGISSKQQEAHDA